MCVSVELPAVFTRVEDVSLYPLCCTSCKCLVRLSSYHLVSYISAGEPSSNDCGMPLRGQRLEILG